MTTLPFKPSGPFTISGLLRVERSKLAKKLSSFLKPHVEPQNKTEFLDVFFQLVQTQTSTREIQANPAALLNTLPEACYHHDRLQKLTLGNLDRFACVRLAEAVTRVHLLEREVLYETLNSGESVSV
jgi:hypothetical protein